jgi:hypothetical protein
MTARTKYAFWIAKISSIFSETTRGRNFSYPESIFGPSSHVGYPIETETLQNVQGYLCNISTMLVSNEPQICDKTLKCKKIRG